MKLFGVSVQSLDLKSLLNSCKFDVMRRFQFPWIPYMKISVLNGFQL